jgi:hypothetical protein
MLMTGSRGQEAWFTRSSFDQYSQFFGAKAQIIGPQSQDMDAAIPVTHLEHRTAAVDGGLMISWQNRQWTNMDFSFGCPFFGLLLFGLRRFG